MKTTATLIALVVLAAALSWADDPAQSDWSGGPGVIGPGVDFGGSFADSEGISWLTIPGQLVLSSQPLANPVRVTMAERGPRGAYGLATGDIDIDGDVDVLGTTDVDAGVLLWLNTGADPPSWELITIDASFPGGTSVHPTDVDGDGDFDLVAAAQLPGHRVAWWRNDASDLTTWTRFDVERIYPVACNVFAGDIDGDARPDVLSTSWSFSTVDLWRNDGGDPVTWSHEILARTQNGAHSAVATDLDGDGDADVVAVAANNSVAFVLRNEGGDPLQWTREVLGADLGGVRYAATADIDRSGTPDVVAAAADGQVVWWANDGGPATTWPRTTIDTGCYGGHWVDLDDIDGDGRVDVLVAAYTLGSIHWYRNEGGDPPVWSRHAIGEALGTPLTAVAADIDGRGDLEVVGAASDAGVFSWWKVTEFVPTGTLTSSVLDLGDWPWAAEVTWDAHVPPATSLTLELRVGDDADDLGPWERLNAPGALPTPHRRYVQYRILLATDDPSLSPVVREVTVHTGLPIDDRTRREAGPVAAE